MASGAPSLISFDRALLEATQELAEELAAPPQSQSAPVLQGLSRRTVRQRSDEEKDQKVKRSMHEATGHRRLRTSVSQGALHKDAGTSKMASQSEEKKQKQIKASVVVADEDDQGEIGRCELIVYYLLFQCCSFICPTMRSSNDKQSN